MALSSFFRFSVRRSPRKGLSLTLVCLRFAVVASPLRIDSCSRSEIVFCVAMLALYIDTYVSPMYTWSTPLTFVEGSGVEPRSVDVGPKREKKRQRNSDTRTCWLCGTMLTPWARQVCDARPGETSYIPTCTIHVVDQNTRVFRKSRLVERAKTSLLSVHAIAAFGAGHLTAVKEYVRVIFFDCSIACRSFEHKAQVSMRISGIRAKICECAWQPMVAADGAPSKKSRQAIPTTVAVKINPHHTTNVCNYCCSLSTTYTRRVGVGRSTHGQAKESLTPSWIASEGAPVVLVYFQEATALNILGTLDVVLVALR